MRLARRSLCAALEQRRHHTARLCAWAHATAEHSQTFGHHAMISQILAKSCTTACIALSSTHRLDAERERHDVDEHHVLPTRCHSAVVLFMARSSSELSPKLTHPSLFSSQFHLDDTTMPLSGPEV